MHHGQTGGKGKTHKVGLCKKTRRPKLYEIRGKFEKVRGEILIFPKWGEMY